MTKRIMMLIAVLTAFGCIAFSATSMVGVVSDSNCGLKHSTASASAASCVASCVSSGAKYVLVSHGKVYQVSPQSKFSEYAGQLVSVHGDVTGDSIAVTSVAAAHKGRHQDPAKAKSGSW